MYPSRVIVSLLVILIILAGFTYLTYYNEREAIQREITIQIYPEALGSGSYLVASAFLSIPGVGVLGPSSVSYENNAIAVSFDVPLDKMTHYRGFPHLPTATISLVDYNSGRAVTLSISSFDTILFSIYNGEANPGSLLAEASRRVRVDPLDLLQKHKIKIGPREVEVLSLSDSIFVSRLVDIADKLYGDQGGNWTRWERYPEGFVIDTGILRSYDTWRYQQLNSSSESLSWWYDHVVINQNISEPEKRKIAWRLWGQLVKDLFSSRYLVNKSQFDNDLNRAVRGLACMIMTYGKMFDCPYSISVIELSFFLNQRNSDASWINTTDPYDSDLVALPILAYNWTLLDIDRRTASHYEVTVLYSSFSANATVKSGMFFGFFVGVLSETYTTRMYNHVEDLVFADQEKQFYIYYDAVVNYYADSILVYWDVRNYNDSYWLVIPVATITTPYTFSFDPTNVTITRNETSLSYDMLVGLARLEATVSYEPSGSETSEVTLWEFNVSSTEGSSSSAYFALLDGPPLLTPLLAMMPGGSYITQFVIGMYSALSSTAFITTNSSITGFEVQFMLQASYPEPGQDAVFYIKKATPTSRLLFGAEEPFYNLVHIDMSKGSQPAPCAGPVPCGGG